MDNKQSDEEIFNKTIELLNEDVKTEGGYGKKNKDDVIRKETNIKPWMVGVAIFLCVSILFSASRQLRYRTFDEVGRMKKEVNSNLEEERINNYNEVLIDYGYSSYDYYDEEYDTNNDNYLSYDEKEELYQVLKQDFIKNVSLELLFKSKTDNKVYFRINNENEEVWERYYLSIAFFDAKGKLVGVENSIYVSGTADIICFNCDYEFDSFQYIITINDYSLDKKLKNEAFDVSINYRELDGDKFEYGVTNNTKFKLSGYLYWIFYNDKNEIVGIYSDNVFDFKGGKTINEYIYISDRDLVFDHVELDTSSLAVSTY